MWNCEPVDSVSSGKYKTASKLAVVNGAAGMKQPEMGAINVVTMASEVCIDLYASQKGLKIGKPLAMSFTHLNLE